MTGPDSQESPSQDGLPVECTGPDLLSGALVRERGGARGPETQRPREDKDRDWSDASTNPDIPKVAAAPGIRETGRSRPGAFRAGLCDTPGTEGGWIPLPGGPRVRPRKLMQCYACIAAAKDQGYCMSQRPAT